MGDDRGVDRVGLRQPANRAGELTHLARVDDCHRQAGFNQRGGNHAFIAAASLVHNQARRQRLQSLNQRAQTFRARRTAKPVATWSALSR